MTIYQRLKCGGNFIGVIVAFSMIVAAVLVMDMGMLVMMIRHVSILVGVQRRDSGELPKYKASAFRYYSIGLTAHIHP